MSDNRLEFAKRIAIEAGKLAQKMRLEPDQLSAQIKGPMDVVTAADRAVEDLLRKRIMAFDAQASILGEEAGLWGDNTAMWILDPIDGTVNFSRGMPEWAISIAYFDGTDLTHGVIHAPDLNLMAAAEKGNSATLNGADVTFEYVQSPCPIVALGYSSRSSIDQYISCIKNLLDAGVEHRRLGAATIGFLGILAGWFDAYFEPQLNIWDAAAGLVIVKAAGGIIRHEPFESFLKKPSDILIQNGDNIDEALLNVGNEFKAEC